MLTPELFLSKLFIDKSTKEQFMKKIISLLAVSLFISMSALAVEKNHPCKADRENFCKDVKVGDGAIAKCLKEHEASLSAECKASFEANKAKREARKEERKAKMEEKKAMHEARKASREACKSDMEKFCKDIKPGEGKKMNCLKEHASELSEGCKVGFQK